MTTGNSLIMKCAFWRKVGHIQPCLKNITKISNHYGTLVQLKTPLVIVLQFSDYYATYRVSVVLSHKKKLNIKVKP